MKYVLDIITWLFVYFILWLGLHYMCNGVEIKNAGGIIYWIIAWFFIWFKMIAFVKWNFGDCEKDPDNPDNWKLQDKAYVVYNNNHQTVTLTNAELYIKPEFTD